MRSWWERSEDEILLPVTTLPEITYLLARRVTPRAELEFVRAVADGEFAVEALESEDYGRAADLMGVYADAEIGFVDATIASVAERLEVTAILTTDRRHFSLIRPRHVPAFRLVP